jgi:YD repeat-containing protein
VLAATTIAESGRALYLLSQINQVALQTHATLGYVLSGPDVRVFLGGGSQISLQSEVSANSFNAVANDRQAAYYTAATVMNRLEGGVMEQMFDVLEGNSSASLTTRNNATGNMFYQVTSSNISTVAGASGTCGANHSVSQLTNYLPNACATLYQLVGEGYTVIAPNNGYAAVPLVDPILENGMNVYSGGTGDAGFFADVVGANSITLADAWADDQGANSYSPSPLEDALNSVKLADYSIKAKKYYGVDLKSGALTLTPPADLEAGIGEFPYKLSFQRYYTEALDEQAGNSQTYAGALDYHQADPQYRPVDIGGGWSNNWSIFALSGSDGLAGLGRDAGLNATAAIAGLFTLRALDAGTPPLTFQQKLATVFATNWWVKSLQNNIVTIQRPPNSSVFVQLADGSSFNPVPGTAESLVATGSPATCATSSGVLTFSHVGTSYALTGQDGSVLSFTLGKTTPDSTGHGCGNDGGYYVPSAWTFPSGAAITFTYNPSQVSPWQTSGGSGGPTYEQLSSVSNNLGRALSFAYDTGTGALTGVTDTLSSREVQFSTNVNNTSVFNTANVILPASMYVIFPDSMSVRYDYLQIPSTGAVNRRYAQIYQWYTPTDLNDPFRTASYDTLYRVNAITDNSLQAGFASNYSTNYYITGLYGYENQKRSETVDPLSAITTDYYDINGNLTAEIDPLLRATYYSYDSARRLTLKTYPLKNSTAYTYDVRSNLLSTTENPVLGSSATTYTSSTTYKEGPGMFPCVTPATCNQPYQETDSRGYTSTYSYFVNGSQATGLVQRVVGPTVSAQTGGVSGNAQTDYCYTMTSASSGSVALPTGMIKKVSAASNRVTSFAYNSAANHLTLANATADPSSTLTPPASAGGSCGTGSESGAFNLTTSFTYDSAGNVSSITDPLSNTINYNFDSMRRLTRIQEPAISVSGSSVQPIIRYTYTQDGLLLATRHSLTANPIDSNPSNPYSTEFLNNPNQWQTESRNYFATGDLQSVTDANGNVTTYAYDPDSRQRVVQDGDGRQVATVYDLAGEVLATWRGGSGWIDTHGQASTAPSASTSWTPSSYSNTGALRHELYGSYDSNGRPLSVTDADGNTTLYTYDAFDRLVTTTYADSLTESLWYTSDNSSNQANRCSASDQPCRKVMRNGDYVTYHYDTMDRKDMRTPQIEGGYTYGLDLLGETLQVSKVAQGAMPAHTTVYTYDTAGRKHSEANDGLQVSYGYDNGGNRTQLTWPDGYYVTYQYDAMHHMTYARQNGTTELANYTYDILSRRNYLCLGGQSASCVSGGGTN